MLRDWFGFGEWMAEKYASVLPVTVGAAVSVESWDYGKHGCGD